MHSAVLYAFFGGEIEGYGYLRKKKNSLIYQQSTVNLTFYCPQSGKFVSIQVFIAMFISVKAVISHYQSHNGSMLSVQD